MPNLKPADGGSDEEEEDEEEDAADGEAEWKFRPVIVIVFAVRVDGARSRIAVCAIVARTWCIFIILNAPTRKSVFELNDRQSKSAKDEIKKLRNS